MSLERKAVLVTGGTGMLGAHLVRRLVRQSVSVAVLSRPNANRIRLRDIEGEIEVIDGEIADVAALRKVFDRIAPAAVFHLASTSFNPPGQPASSHIDANVAGMTALCEALPEATGVRIVYTNTGAVYGGGAPHSETHPLNPATILGATKACAGVLGAALAIRKCASFADVRLFTPFGPWERPQRLIPSVILSALAGRDFAIRGGAQKRDYLYVEDTVDALILAAEADLDGVGVFNIASGESRAVVNVAQRILDLMGNPVRLVVGEKPARSDEIWNLSASIGAAKKILGWSPVTALDEGLERTIAWFRDNRTLAEQLP